MRARLSRPEEMYKIDLINCVAFESPWEPPKPEENGQPGDMHWWISEDGDDFCGCIGVLPAKVRFDGHIVGMSGIGGVATLPQHRRKGAIRVCMNAALKDMRERGDVFSVLYPFSRAYYRQFGYEDGATVNMWTVQLSAIRLPDAGGSLRLIMPGDDMACVHQVYRTCAENWNLSFEESRFLHSLEKRNWMKDKRYLYVWFDDNGTPGGMILFSKVDNVMDCRMEFSKPNVLLFRDARALAALLNFAKGFAADYDSIRFMAPQGVRVQSLIAEGNDAECEACYNCMARLVNVQRALEMCAAAGEGEIVISVTDDILAENAGAWRVKFNPGGNIVEKTDDAADVEMPVGELTQLLLGVCCADDLPMMPRVKVNNPGAPMERIFMRKHCLSLDLF